MTERSLEFRRYGCRMTLNMPVAMEEMPITNLRKFFKLMDEEYWRNEESTRSFFSYIPEILEDLKDKWNEESLKFQKEYQDPKFDSSGNYISDKEMREKRRNHNKRLMNKVKAAKARYERFQKKVPKLKELQEQYSH